MARLDLSRWFKQAASIYYLETVSDSYGGFKKNWVRKYYRVPCRIFGESGNYTIEEQGISYLVEKRLLVDIDIEVNKGDRVEVGDDKYLVLRSDKAGAGADHHTVARLGRLEEQTQ